MSKLIVGLVAVSLLMGTILAPVAEARRTLFPRVAAVVQNSQDRRDVRAFNRVVRNDVRFRQFAVFAPANVLVNVNGIHGVNGFQTVRFNTFGTRTVVDGLGNVFEVDVNGNALARGNIGGFNQFGGLQATVFHQFGSTVVVANDSFVPNTGFAVKVRTFSFR